MSTSPEPQTAKVIADAGSPSAAVSIRNSQMQVVAVGGGRVEADLAAGVYKVRYSTGADVVERLFEVSPDHNPMYLPRPQLTTPREAFAARVPSISREIEDSLAKLRA